MPLFFTLRLSFSGSETNSFSSHRWWVERKSFKNSFNIFFGCVNWKRNFRFTINRPYFYAFLTLHQKLLTSIWISALHFQVLNAGTFLCNPRTECLKTKCFSDHYEPVLMTIKKSWWLANKKQPKHCTISLRFVGTLYVVQSSSLNLLRRTYLQANLSK